MRTRAHSLSRRGLYFIYVSLYRSLGPRRPCTSPARTSRVASLCSCMLWHGNMCIPYVTHATHKNCHLYDYWTNANRVCAIEYTWRRTLKWWVIYSLSVDTCIRSMIYALCRPPLHKRISFFLFNLHVAWRLWERADLWMALCSQLSIGPIGSAVARDIFWGHRRLLWSMIAVSCENSHRTFTL